MKAITYMVYDFKELKDEAKQKAIDKWYEHEDYPMLERDLKESCMELLTENKITYNGDLSLCYSLSCCQGDGLSFMGNFKWKKYNINITHTWKYSFASASEIVIADEEGEELDDTKIYDKFKSIYLDICEKLEREGYSILEYRMDFDEFNEHCEADGYNFLEDGTMDNS